jgi:membrane dipeptidase
MSCSDPGMGTDVLQQRQAMTTAGREFRIRAQELIREIVVVDTHIDLPDRLLKSREDISVLTRTGDFDYVRARNGGLGLVFLALYVPPVLEGSPQAMIRAQALLDVVDAMVERWPDKFGFALSPGDLPAMPQGDRVLIALGLENGAPLDGNPAHVAWFAQRGVRYITLSHMKSNHLCDSSGDVHRPWHGLSPFGKQVVAEMNRQGIMIDVSHISDEAFYDVLRNSRVPVIASHSSCRAFTPGWERNMDDTMIAELAGAGGVIQINFGSSFVRSDIRALADGEAKAVDAFRAATGAGNGSNEEREFVRDYRESHPRPYADVSDVARHIDHVAQLAGIDHVGIGSDFDGLGDQLPTGLKDVSMYPNLLAELLALGYSEVEIAKVCSGNILRVWKSVEDAARAAA